MKYRGQSKIKRQHHLIDELDPLLKVIEQWEEVLAINPGVISVCRHNDRLKLTVQYRDRNGLRCLARSHGAVQEVFITSDAVERLEERIRELCR